MAYQFSRELIQAISDWQRGGDAEQSRRRGEALKVACQDLPAQFRECSLVCFRQIGIVVKDVWALFGEDRLPEKISAWTVDLDVAKGFKGGVPPKDGGYQGVIFHIHPPVGSVIVNLRELYKDGDFRAALHDHKPDITGFDRGAGAYGDLQSEVVLELSTVHQQDVYSLGGWSSPGEELIAEAAEELYGRKPETEVERKMMLLDVSDIANAPMWLIPDLTKGVLARVKPHADRLKAQKAGRDAGGRG